MQEINHRKKGGATALYLASQNGHHEVVFHLLQNGARASVQKKVEVSWRASKSNSGFPTGVCYTLKTVGPGTHTKQHTDMVDLGVEV